MTGQMPDASFLKNCAFVSVDIQEGKRGDPTTEETLPPDWKMMGFTPEDVDAAADFWWEVGVHNAVKVVEACRRATLPMIFIHWGFQFPDGMDLDPIIYRMMKKNCGADPTKWGGYIKQPGSQPATCLNIQPTDYVIAKTAQDAFISSNIHFVLANLGVHHLVLIGGHSEACLGKTATSAKRLGFTTLIVEDATNNARESTRRKGILESQCDYILTTEQFLQLADAVC